MRLLSLMLAIASAAGAAVMPRADGELLSGPKVVLPDLFHGRRAVLVAGFSKASGKAADAWRERLEKELPDVVIYECAVLESVPGLIRGMITASMRKNTPADRRARFVVLLHGEKPWKIALGFGPPDDAYVAAIDEQGNLVWRGHGTMPAASVPAIRQALGR